MSDHYITYLELTDDERTSCSTLSDALSPTNRPQYELPQDVYHPKARTPLVRGMDPILFHEWSGAPWVSLPGLHGNLAELANTMLGGWDLVFAQRPNRQMKIELRIMVRGYICNITVPVVTTAAVARIHRSIYHSKADLSQARRCDYNARDACPDYRARGRAFYAG